MTRMNWKKITQKEVVKRREAEHQKKRLQEELAKSKAKAEIKLAQMRRAAMKEAPVSAPQYVTTPPENQFNITSQPELITPAIATQWLEGHVHNRALTHAKAIGYAEDMKRGLWNLNGEPMIFDWDGTMQNGQHRCWACIESNTEFWSMVTRGVDPATFITIDTGKSRSAADVLSIEKIPNHTTVAAAARIVMAYWRGEPRAGSKYPNREVLAFVKANPDIATWVSKARQAPVTNVPTHLAAILFVGAQTYADQADVFLRQFKTGENLAVGSPILTIRNRIFTDKTLRSGEKFELIVRAWNAFVENRILLKSIVSRAGQFPKIKGDLRT